MVDDDVLVRKLVADMLAESREFNVLMATSAALALQQSKEFQGDIDLLLTDFEMPGMTGIELATAMTIDRPRLKVLMMSGFVGGMLILNEGWHFLPKPFIPSQLHALIVGLVYPDKESKFNANASWIDDAA